MIRKRVRSYKVGFRGDVNGWHNSLVDVPAFIIGNSPSLDDIDLKPLKHHFTIGINRAFYVIDPTILMWQDSELWWNHRAEIGRTKAIKFCKDLADPKGRFYHFKLANGGYKLPERPSLLHGRGSTGPLAFQLAWIMGCNPIVMLGMDCRYRDGKTDFYGKNPSHKPHTLQNCSRGLEWIKNCKCNREVITCSTSKVFDIAQSFEQVLGSLPQDKPWNYESLRKKILGKDDS